ncbi:MAG: chromate resistance protein [Thermodesulfovibrionales bacterium]
MTRSIRTGTGKKRAGEGWLIFFYRVPAKPVNNRVRIWRRLAKAGAVQLKGAVYILPFSDEHYELLQWLTGEVRSLKGEAAFARTDRVETMTDTEVRELFGLQRSGEYRRAEKALEELERRLASIRKGSGIQGRKALSPSLDRIEKDFNAIRSTDFFGSPAGSEAEKRIRRARQEIRQLPGADRRAAKPEIAPRKAGDYRKRTWATRKNPFIDRMASAWLIRRFIDPEASFAFFNEKELPAGRKGLVTFDVSNGDFTHQADLCTFEVLIRAFGIRDKTARKIGEIVHELDIKDDKYRTSQARGLEEILTGIRKTASDDRDALEKGMSVFEMLYVSST